MKNMKRILVTLVAAVLLMAVTVAGTLAYLQAQTEKVVNTFTYGNVKFDLKGGLDEALVNDYGQPINNDTDKTVVELTAAPRVMKNDYKLIPGHNYTKDPTVHIAAGSEPCWVFVKVDNGIADIEAEGSTTIAAQMTANKWVQLKVTDKNGDEVEVPNVFYYATIVDNLNATAKKDLIVFSSFTLNGTIEENKIDDYTEAQVVIDAYLIQADGLTTAQAAWAAAQADWSK